MNILAVLLLVCGQTSLAAAHPSAPPRPYNVLFLSPISAPSHNKILMSIATALADRGHKITLLTNYEITERRENITTLTHGLPYAKSENVNLFEQGRSHIDIIKLIPGVLYNMSRDIYKTPVVAELYRRKDEFDVVFIDIFYNEIMYPFAAGKPFISLAPCCNDPVPSASFGNTPDPAYVSHPFYYFQNPWSIVDRVHNLCCTLIIPVVRYLTVFVPMQYHISRQFPDLPSLAEIERNQSAAFVNSDYSMVVSPPEPLLPGQVEIGGIHCREGRPLPQDLHDFTSSDEPVVLMSLGSALSVKYLADEHREMFISAFNKLPYRIIWKFDHITNVPSNVMIKDWLPQQDLLAHPNVKLFITHGGTLSMQEAVYHATPMLALPITSDQPKNGMRLQNMGIGLTLSWDYVTEDQILNAVKKIITEPQYQEKVSKMSSVFRDQQDTPSERAVYWTEYVVRHRGAAHLRSPERDLSWIVLLRLDVLAVLCVGIGLFCFVAKGCFRFCWSDKKLRSGKDERKIE